MRRWVLLAPFLFALTACHQRRAAPAAPLVDEVRARAEKAFHEIGSGATAAPVKPSIAPVPEVPVAVSKIGEPDASLGCTWVETEATVPVSGAQTRDQARASSVEEARETAMRDLLGVDLSNRSLTFQQDGLRGQNTLLENMLRATRRGCVLKEKISAEEYRDLGACRQCAYFVHLRSCIKERASDADKDFHVEIALNRDNMVEGDEAKLSITSSRDAYLYVYDVGMNSDTSLIAPNEIFPRILVKAGEAWVYPDDAAAKRGVHLVAQLPEGKPPVSAEVVRVVAAKTPLPAKLVDPANGGYLGVMQRLNASPYEWVEDAAAFTIYPAKGK